MGLDMYAFKRVVRDDGAIEREEIKYWRKHHALHGAMQAIFIARGGKGEFNCIELELTPRDLDSLEAQIKSHTLPHTSGFFFGVCPPDEESDAADLAFISDARRAISEGYQVFYDSWW